MYTIHPFYLLGPACSISTILSEFYLLNIVSPGCNLILAELHMQDVILTSHLESLLKKKKKSKSQHSSRGMNQSDKNVYRGSLISSWELVSRTSTWTVRLNHLHKLSWVGSVVHSAKVLFSYFQLETRVCISRMGMLAKATTRMSKTSVTFAL